MNGRAYKTSLNRILQYSIFKDFSFKLLEFLK
jgi:hypothetical protein